jgi:uncharacterized RDD family membrane protein YckC
MNNIPRQEIQKLMIQSGRSLLDHPARLEGILKDTCGQCTTEIFLLVTALKEQVPQALLSSSKSGMPVQFLLAQQVDKLHLNRGFEKTAAQWAVESWALALGIIATDQKQHNLPASSSTAAPQATQLDGQIHYAQPHYAGIDRRFFAYLLDGFILLIPNIVISYVVRATYAELLTTEAAATAADFLVGIVLYWLYEAFQESSAKQATLGKQALKIVVTDLNSNRISFGKATRRHFSKWISGLTLVGFFLPFFNEKKQALHDILAGCLVVRK